MRQAGKMINDVHYYIPRNREEYIQKHPPTNVIEIPDDQPPPAPKTQAAASANLAISPSSIPATQVPPPPSQRKQTMSDDMFDGIGDDDDIMEPTDASVNAGWGWY